MWDLKKLTDSYSVKRWEQKIANFCHKRNYSKLENATSMKIQNKQSQSL